MNLWCKSHRICPKTFYNKTVIDMSKNIKKQLTLQNVSALGSSKLITKTAKAVCI